MHILTKKNIKRLHGQSVLEYLLLVGVIVVALFAMMQAIKRSGQSLLKVAADEIGNQQNSDQSFDIELGYLDSSNSMTSSQNEKRVVDRIGLITYTLNDAQGVLTNAKTNLGFTEGSP